MYEFFEGGLRGGMTFVNQHLAQKTDDRQLLYIDVNNLYGWALSQNLPCGDFQWVTDQSILQDIVTHLPDEESDHGYVLQIDFHIPQNMHDKLSDLPPAPMSECPPGSRVPKLLLTLKDKTHYIVHSALLKFYIQVMGIVVTKVHRAIRFSQTKIFKNYIDYNTAKRAQSTNKFQKDYYKLKNNSLYGKTVENLRKRQDLRLCTRRSSFMTHTSKPNFKRAIPIDEDLVAVVLSKETICLNRPVYVGQAVLDLSKLRMYRLHYEDMERYRQLYPNSSIKILAGDTDSFFLEVRNVDLNTQLLPKMLQDGLLDTSNFPPNHPLHSRQHENKIGLVKDESAGIEDYVEWLFLRPKCYSLLSSDSSATHKAKGITRATKFTHDQYRNVFNSYDPNGPDSPECVRVEQRNIVSSVHQLYTVSYNKRALSIMDDKREWWEQNYSLPYGHYIFDA